MKGFAISMALIIVLGASAGLAGGILGSKKMQRDADACTGRGGKPLHLNREYRVVCLSKDALLPQ